MHDRAIGMAVGHAGRPDPETARRSVPSAWPGSWAGGADSSGHCIPHVHAAIASIWEVAMPSAPVSDSWEGPKRRGATGDAIFGNNIFDLNVRSTPFRPS
jgi:hypothetical protein